MLLALIAPEVIILWAIRQWFAAHNVANIDCGIGMTRGFFVSMGGFVVPDLTSQELVPVTADMIGSRITVTGLISTTEQDIKDRSKGDALSKGIALLQVLWFVAQCIARGVGHNSISGLELVTLGFASLNVVLYLIWWYKPLNVTWAVCITAQQPNRGEAKDAIPAITKKPFALSAGWKVFESAVEVLLGEGIPPSIHDSARRVPMLWTGPLRDSQRAGAAVAVAVLAMLFGAIHCIAWSLFFPSQVERYLWRISSVAIAGIPALFLLDTCIIFITGGSKFYRLISGYVIFPLGVTVYVLARMVLLLESLISLRALPPDVYHTVQWTSLIPHI